MKNCENVWFFHVEGLKNCPFTGFTVTADSNYLYRLDFVLDTIQIPDYIPEPYTIQILVREQIQAYLSGRLRKFELPILQRGTEFQKKVWTVIDSIPYGKVFTYGQVAEKLGDSRLARAVGQAANSNPIPLIIPCHRVVGARGKLTGFASGIAVKRYLLSNETGNRLW